MKDLKRFYEDIIKTEAKAVKVYGGARNGYSVYINDKKISLTQDEYEKYVVKGISQSVIYVSKGEMIEVGEVTKARYNDSLMDYFGFDDKTDGLSWVIVTLKTHDIANEVKRIIEKSKENEKIKNIERILEFAIISKSRFIGRSQIENLIKDMK